MQFPMRPFRSAYDNAQSYVRHHFFHANKSMSIEELEALRKRAYDANPYKGLKARTSFIEGVDVLINAHISNRTAKEQPVVEEQPEQPVTPETTRYSYEVKRVSDRVTLDTDSIETADYGEAQQYALQLLRETSTEHNVPVTVYMYAGGGMFLESFEQPEQPVEEQPAPAATLIGVQSPSTYSPYDDDDYSLPPVEIDPEGDYTPIPVVIDPEPEQEPEQPVVEKDAPVGWNSWEDWNDCLQEQERTAPAATPSPEQASQKQEREYTIYFDNVLVGTIHSDCSIMAARAAMLNTGINEVEILRVDWTVHSVTYHGCYLDDNKDISYEYKDTHLQEQPALAPAATPEQQDYEPDIKEVWCSQEAFESVKARILKAGWRLYCTETAAFTGIGYACIAYYKPDKPIHFATPSPEYSQFLADTVDDPEYTAYLEHIHTPRASEY